MPLSGRASLRATEPKIARDNDTLDVIDGTTDRFLHSIPNLMGVAGALVSDERRLVCTSNRGENTIGIFSPDDEANIVKVNVGLRPNGLAYDFKRNLLLAANVGDPAIPNSFTVSIVNMNQRMMTASIPVPGRTRWTVFDADADLFYVNLSDPAQIVVVDPKKPTQIERTYPIPVAGPHGLDLDTAQHHLFCACDGKKLLTVDAQDGERLGKLMLLQCELAKKDLLNLMRQAREPQALDTEDPTTLRLRESATRE